MFPWTPDVSFSPSLKGNESSVMWQPEDLMALCCLHRAVGMSTVWCGAVPVICICHLLFSPTLLLPLCLLSRSDGASYHWHPISCHCVWCLKSLFCSCLSPSIYSVSNFLSAHLFFFLPFEQDVCMFIYSSAMSKHFQRKVITCEVKCAAALPKRGIKFRPFLEDWICIFCKELVMPFFATVLIIKFIIESRSNKFNTKQHFYFLNENVSILTCLFCKH